MSYRTTYLFIRFLSGLLVCAQIFLYGCATPGHTPDVNPQRDSSFEFPDVIVYSNHEAGVEFDLVQSKAEGAAAGVASAFDVCNPSCDSFLASAALIMAPLGAVIGAVEAESSDVVDAVKANLQQSIPQENQKKLANDVHERLAKATANSPMLISSDAIDDVYRGKNYHTILTVTFQKFIFKSLVFNNDPICLQMQATATKFDVLT